MDKDFSFTIHLSPEAKERLNATAQRVGVPRELVVELAVEEFLKDPDLEELTRPHRHEPNIASSSRAEVGTR